MNAGDVRITNARCANETAVVLHHHQRGRATDCCDDGTQPDDHVPPPRGNQHWLPARIIDCKPGCGRDLYPEREPSKWKVEISAVSDLRPRGQWPQGHINADVNLRAATGRVRGMSRKRIWMNFGRTSPRRIGRRFAWHAAALSPRLRLRDPHLNPDRRASTL